MNHIYDIELGNRYFALRHGESMPNVLGIILSDPKSGTIDFGLSDKGKEQARQSVVSALERDILDEFTAVYSSDFKRARETAEIARGVLNTLPVIYTEKLRERYFGEWERTSHVNYANVWRDDKVNPSHTNYSVESADHVQDRTTRLILQLERQYYDRKILLVSHGDALQILQTGFLRLPASMHRDIPHLETAEIRELVR